MKKNLFAAIFASIFMFSATANAAVDAAKAEEFVQKVTKEGIEEIINANVSQSVKDNNVFGNLNQQIEYVRQKIAYHEEMLYNSRNEREYRYAEKELKDYKNQLKEILPDSKTEVFIEQYNSILRKNPDIDYRGMTKILDNIFTNALGVDFVSNMFLKMGYDGYKIDFEYIIFNFDKLKQYTVKDKNALLEKLMNNN